MTVLPIVERELRVAARRRTSHAVRVAAAGIGIVIFGWMTLLFFQDAVPSTARGLRMFLTLFGFAFIYCLLSGARLTADCLSEEKREDTLGLLFLTDLKGYDVVLGKLVATSLNSLYGLLAILPVMALTTQLGGVTGDQLARAALVLLNTLFFSLTAGLCVSTVSRNERKAMFAAVLVVLAATFGPLIFVALLANYWPGTFEQPAAMWPILVLSPGYSFWALTFDSGGFLPFPKSSFWWSLVLVHLMGWLSFSLSSHILPRIWQRSGSDSALERQRERIEQLAYGRSADRSSFRRQLLDINPFLWLAGRQRWKHFYVWAYFACVGGTWLWGWFKYGDVMTDKRTLIPTVLIFQAFLKIWVVSEACTRLVEDRRSGALELLLSTPLTVREILHGQWLSLRRQFVKPLIAIVVCEWIVLRPQFAVETIIVNIAMLLADMIALGWVGMWLGLNAQNTNRAILGAIVRVLILPWAIYYVGGEMLEFIRQLLQIGSLPEGYRVQLFAWTVIGVAIDFGLGYAWARRRLTRDFREVAIQRSESRRSRWFGMRIGHESATTIPARVATS